eukprot:CAMPEP_0114983396 /NCGR_PEP_ID=MMETSP0216-20121206/6671_1 /TAXON_ID=223996 /ORGANISM="Protocruzia adherens, Strain Boccale" /LENGTH=265 /DNA_ID=CAMNT_0002345363 /DNA_START=1690 /DNA_END=2487 /DNA_ORIENTATION=+
MDLGQDLKESQRVELSVYTPGRKCFKTDSPQSASSTSDGDHNMPQEENEATLLLSLASPHGVKDQKNDFKNKTAPTMSAGQNQATEVAPFTPTVVTPAPSRTSGVENVKESNANLQSTAEKLLGALLSTLNTNPQDVGAGVQMLTQFMGAASLQSSANKLLNGNASCTYPSSSSAVNSQGTTNTASNDSNSFTDSLSKMTTAGLSLQELRQVHSQRSVLDGKASRCADVNLQLPVTPRATYHPDLQKRRDEICCFFGTAQDLSVE